MSHRLSISEEHGLHEDARSVKARDARREALEVIARRLAHEKHARRMQPLLASAGLPSLDFDGCTE